MDVSTKQAKMESGSRVRLRLSGEDGLWSGHRDRASGMRSIGEIPGT